MMRRRRTGGIWDPPSQADLDRVFYLDAGDLGLVGRHRGEHMRPGFALQLTTVRWLGTFLEDPPDVPAEVVGKEPGMYQGRGPMLRQGARNRSAARTCT
jgi:hypothetical protein